MSAPPSSTTDGNANRDSCVCANHDSQIEQRLVAAAANWGTTEVVVTGSKKSSQEITYRGPVSVGRIAARIAAGIECRSTNRTRTECRARSRTRGRAWARFAAVRRTKTAIERTARGVTARQHRTAAAVWGGYCRGDDDFILLDDDRAFGSQGRSLSEAQRTQHNDEQNGKRKGQQFLHLVFSFCGCRTWLLRKTTSPFRQLSDPAGRILVSTKIFRYLNNWRSFSLKNHHRDHSSIINRNVQHPSPFNRKNFSKFSKPLDFSK